MAAFPEGADLMFMPGRCKKTASTLRLFREKLAKAGLIEKLFERF
jgi:hypothetical protein